MQELLQKFDIFVTKKREIVTIFHKNLILKMRFLWYNVVRGEHNV